MDPSNHAPIPQCISSILLSIFIKWVLVHFTIPGNDLADRATKKAATMGSDTIHPKPIPRVFQVINELFHDNPPSHEHTSEIYQHHKTLTNLQQMKS